jgi:hypothetical protein
MPDPSDARWHLNQRIRAATEAANRAWDAYRDAPHDADDATIGALETNMVAASRHLDYLYDRLRKVELKWDCLTIDEQENLAHGRIENRA